MERTVAKRQNNVPLCVFLDGVIGMMGCYIIPLLFPQLGFRGIALFTYGLVQTLCLILFFAGFDMYTMIPSTPRESFISIALSHFYTMSLFLLADVFFFRGGSYGWGILSSTVLSCVGIWVWRRFYFAYRNRHQMVRLLIVESDKHKNDRARKLKYNSLGRYDSWYELFNCENIEGVQDFIDKELDKYHAICLMDQVDESIRKLFISSAVRKGKALYFLPDAYDVNCMKLNLTRFDDILAFYVPPMTINMFQRVVKRAVDLIGSVAMLTVAALPMLVIALLIRHTSEGPVFYKQTRLTKDQREFEIYKFRSMIVNAEKQTGPVFSVYDDPRVTKVGRILRKTRMDELPQLFNILKGDMSLVGPRPERPFFVERYRQTIDFYDLRFAVKAGMTSLSHVYGRYSTDIRDRTIYDLMYIRNYSLLMDIRILLLTSRIVFLRDASDGIHTEDPYAPKRDFTA